MPLSRRSTKWITFAFVVTIYATAMWVGRRDVPLTDDAFEYLGAAQAYNAWYRLAWHTIREGGDAFRSEVVDRYFQVNSVHPPVAKSVFGGGIALFHDKLGWLDEIDAARVGVMCLSTVVCGLIFLLCWPVYGARVSVSAPLFLLVMPRFFFDSHIESLDVAGAATYFAAVYCFWRARRGWGWAIAAGVMAGVAMSTKINGALAIAPAAMSLIVDAQRADGSSTVRRRDLRRSVVALTLMVVLAPLVSLALWPWLWSDTSRRLIRYLDFYLNHHPSLFYYFGTIYYVPFAPWHAPFVMTAITTPPPILALAAVGIGVAAWRGAQAAPVDRDVRSLDTLVLLNAIFTLVVVSLPNVPKYGGVKLFLPFFPFLAILAGIGFDAAVIALAGRVRAAAQRRTAFACAALGALVGSMGWRLAGIHPYELSYYNALVGGVAGAERRGFEIQYYDLWDLDLARWLNRTFPDGVRVYFEPNNKEYYRHRDWYYRTGRLHGNVIVLPDSISADLVVLTHEMRWPQYPQLRDRLRSYPVLHRVVVEGVPLLTVYDVRPMSRNADLPE